MPVLGTKLHVPAPRGQLVPRPRLTDRLRDEARLVLVSAPAGFGKTTLLAQWLASDTSGAKHWSTWLGDLTHHDDGTSSFTAPIADQAQLHGVLARLRDIGATLLSLRTLEPPSEEVSSPAGRSASRSGR